MTIEEKYNAMFPAHCTLGEHGKTFRKYGEQCDHITEVGVERIGSTWAWLMCKPKKLVCIDIQHPSEVGGNLDEVIKLAKESGIKFEFICADIRKMSIELTDLLFIDTLHTYEQLMAELKYHAPKVGKFILLHDTETYGTVGSAPGCAGLLPAINEFLETPEGTKWKRLEVFTNQHGLTVLGRV